MKTDETDFTRETGPQTAQSPLPKLPEEVKLSPEEECIQRVCRGDPAAFVMLYEANVDTIYRYFLGKTGKRFEAETLTSETFTRAIIALVEGRYESQGKPFKHWLSGIAHNIMREQVRKLAKTAGNEELDDISENKEVVSKENDPLKTYIQKEGRDTLWGLVGKLPAAEQGILKMRYQDDLSYVEIAGQLGRSEAACKQLHYRALQKLRKLVQEADLEK